MVGKLQGLIDAGFKMASGAVEALRPLGVQLLQASLQTFFIPALCCIESRKTWNAMLAYRRPLAATLIPSPGYIRVRY